MKKPDEQRMHFKLRHGNYEEDRLGDTKNPYYRGIYMGPVGMATTYRWNDVGIIETCVNGVYHKRIRKENLTHRQMSNWCRRTLLEIQSKP